MPWNDKRSVMFTLGCALLELYPWAYRERYGGELRVLLEQSPVTAGTLFDLLLGALDAHLRPGALPAPPVQRMRGTVSAAATLWIALILVGGGFAKTTEDAPFRAAETAHPLLGGARIAVAALAVASVVIVAIGGAPLLSVARQAWSERSVWRTLTAPLVALAVLATATGALVLLARDAHGDGSLFGHVAFATWLGLVVVVAGICALGARAAIQTARLRPTALAHAVKGAWVLSRVMAALTAAMTFYVALLAVYARKLQGFANGPFRVPTGASLAVQVVAMVVITALALITARRGVRSAALA